MVEHEAYTFAVLGSNPSAPTTISVSLRGAPHLFTSEGRQSNPDILELITGLPCSPANAGSLAMTKKHENIKNYFMEHN